MVVFVGVDGEGITRPDGSHDYVLLAASDGSYIEEYGSGGLSTEKCFEFLLDLGGAHKGEIMLGFYTSYDVNMMFRDLPEHILAGLWQGGTRTWRAKQGDFRQYRIEYVPNRVLRLRQGCWHWDDDGKARWTSFRSVTFWDCFQFFQMSFVKALKDWKATDEQNIAEIEEMKDRRGTFATVDPGEIRRYCFDEVRLLCQLMDRVAASLDALDIKLSSWYGAGSIASALFKKYGIAKHIRREWGEDVDGVVMSAYFGGRVETFGVGLIDSECVNYDVRSAYPAAAQDLPSLADCAVIPKTEYDYGEKWAIWHVRWEPSASAKGKPIRLTPFPFRKDKRIFWPHSGEGWYHAEEVRAAMDVFGNSASAIDVTVIDGYAIVPANNERPFGWIPEVYETRAEYKRQGDAREKPLKLGLNSVYGKCAQSIGGKDGKPPPYQCYFWAGAITAACRAALLRGAAGAGERNVLAIATDGLFVRSDVAVIKESDVLGGWEKQAVEPGLMLIQPGVYATPKLGKEKGSFAKSRGFGAKGLRYDELLASWRARKMAASMAIEETRFIGFGYALAVGKLDTMWRRWITGEKVIHFSGTTSKSFDPSADMSADFIPLVSPQAPADVSAPYVPRTRSKEDVAEYELQAEALAAMPDLDDNLFTWR